MNNEKSAKVEIATEENEDVKEQLLSSHPDGGWGWVVVLAAFTTQFVVIGLQNSSGVIFNELVEKFNRPRGETGFVSSISVSVMFLLGPLTTSLCQRFNCRIMSMIGGLLCITGMIASAYAQKLYVMYVSFGLTWGLGTSFCYFPTLIILVPYFNKRLALVNGIVSAGGGFGTLVLSPFIQWFFRGYGVKMTFLMLAALHCLVFLSAFVYRPIQMKYQERQGLTLKPTECEDEKILEDDNSRTKLLNQALKTPPINKKSCMDYEIVVLFSDKAFVAWCIGLSVFMLGYFVPFVHLVRYATLIGIPKFRAAFLISTLSIVATIFKVISGKVAGLKCVNKLKMYQMALLIMGISTTMIPVSRSYLGLSLYTVMFGITESCFIVMIPLITKEIVGVRKLPLALGCVFMIMGFPTTVGAPIAGWIYDYFQDYSYAFYVAGCMNTIGVLIMFFIEYFRENKKCDTIIHESENITNITQKNDTICIEEKKPRPESMMVEYACFGSCQRIFYTEIEMMELKKVREEYRFQLSHDYIMSNTSLYEPKRIKGHPGNLYQHSMVKNASKFDNQAPKCSLQPKLSSSFTHLPQTKNKANNRLSLIVSDKQKAIEFPMILSNGMSVSFVNEDSNPTLSNGKGKELYVVDFVSAV